MNGLEDFDKYQGEDPVRLRMRENLPEPFRVDYPLLKAIRPIDVPALWSKYGDFDKMDCSISTELFRKVWMVTGGGTKFYAWKSEVDGKIYL